MSYVGATLTDKGHEISVRFHGPFYGLVINPKEIKDTSYAILDNMETTNLAELAEKLAKYLCNIFCDGIQVLWVQVDIIAKVNGIMYGTSAEKVQHE